MKLTAEDMLDAFADMTLMELSGFVKQFEDMFGVTAQAVPAYSPDPGVTAPEPEVQDEFTVVLDSFGDKKINVIKEVRSVLGLGLAEAKAFTESLPKPVAENIPADQAETLRKRFTDAGAAVTVR